MCSCYWCWFLQCACLSRLLGLLFWTFCETLSVLYWMSWDFICGTELQVIENCLPKTTEFDGFLTRPPFRTYSPCLRKPGSSVSTISCQKSELSARKLTTRLQCSCTSWYCWHLEATQQQGPANIWQSAKHLQETFKQPPVTQAFPSGKRKR